MVAAAATAKVTLQSYDKSVTSGEEEKEEDENSDRKKRKRDIAEWIDQALKPPSNNEEEEYEGKEEGAGATLASTEAISPGDKDDEACEDDREDNCKDNVLSDAKDTEEESSLGNKGESLLSD